MQENSFVRRAARSVRRHPWRSSLVVVLVLVAGGAFVARDVLRVALEPDRPRDLTLPLVTPMSAGADETVYRIDAARSEVQLGVDEILGGDDQRVELTTQVLGGEVAVSGGAEPGVRFGDLVVNVHELSSDNSLRDKMLRHEYLESHLHRDIRLLDATVEFPDDAEPERVTGATLTGDLEIKGKRFPTTWELDARVVGDELIATATTTVDLVEVEVGPINKVGLVRTSDQVDVRIDLVARDAAGYEAPAKLAVDRVESRSEGTGPSFAADIQPILEENCASCHGAGSIGAMMWELEDAADAAEVADGLAVVTGAGFMPPWPASDVGVPVSHARGLDDAQIAAIADWAAAGAQLDVEHDTPIEAPELPEVREPRPDRVVKMAEPYKGSPSKKDDYRCFILDPEVTEPTFLTAYTFDPDRLDVVHHAIVYRVTAGAELEKAQRLDAEDEGSGWSCFAGMGADSGQRIAGWVPGQRPASFPEGDGFELLPGDVLVAQIHYHYAADAPPDRSGMTLEFADDPAGITALQSRTLIAPVEMPCPPGSPGPLCDRDASLVDVAERFGPAGPVIANILHRGCGTTPEQVAAASDGVTSSTTCDFQVRQPGEVIGMLGHMHEFGSAYRMTLNPDRADEQVLLDIPVWNFAWQLAYAPVDDVVIEQGDVIRVTCTWDRRTKFDPDPRYVVFAEGTDDEMCFSTLTVRPTDGP